MDIIIGTTLSAAQTLTDAMQCCELIEKLSVFGYESELVDLQRTVEAITAVLLDAETKQELSQQAQVYIEELKDAVFEADDLMDEFVTLARQQRSVDADGSLREKVSHFFSRSNPICISYWMSRGIKDIKKKLDALAYNNQFIFNIDPEPIKKRRPETCSYINEVDIIGRECDLERIVCTLIASNDQRDLSFLSIVGMGGLGKTALAQLAFNDPRVRSAFSLRLWACISDQDQKELNVKEVLSKILVSAAGRHSDDQGSTLDLLQHKLKEKLSGKRYMVVLDDVWTEKRDQWCELVKYLIGGSKGSWIVVTTRSQDTATIVGGQMYDLQGLSKENSWSLFQRMAFASDQSNPPRELVKIGRQIVDQCAQVPLSIRVAGSLLYGQDKSKWQSVQEIGFANMRRNENNIMSTLKLSYDHLEAPLKSCFSYCALFPKDYVLRKDMLISLWMAQGYIIPSYESQSIEDVGEEYFLVLSRRCFFQDVWKNEIGEIKSCKIHDLMHDLAQSVSSKEIYATDTIISNLDSKVRHLSITKYEKNFVGKTHIRSVLFVKPFMSGAVQFSMEALVGNCKCLRALSLSKLNIRSLPESIGDLLHLRYLNLSDNSNLVTLPQSITKLYNLQTLILSDCLRLKELPNELNRLIKLRVLDISDCENLTCMPWGMGKLTCIQRLRDFIVGGKESYSSWNDWLEGFEDLKALINLKGRLDVRIKWPKNAMKVVKQDTRREGLYLRSKKHLNGIFLQFEEHEGDERMDDEGAMRLMEDLQPHCNLKILMIAGYYGMILPSWATLLTNLEVFFLGSCWESSLQCLGNLRRLRTLHLIYLPNLEYIEEDDLSSTNSSAIMQPMLGLGSTAEIVSFFPSLEKLVLSELPELKGWKREVVQVQSSNSSNKGHVPQVLPSLPQLKSLSIVACPKLMRIPLCSDLEVLSLKKFNPRLSLSNPQNEGSGVSKLISTLRKLKIDNMSWLNSLPMESFRCIKILKIEEDHEMVNLPEWMQFLTSLQVLKINGCKALESMPKWMPKLTTISKLEVFSCSKSLERRCQSDPPGEDWPYILHIPNIHF